MSAPFSLTFLRMAAHARDREDIVPILLASLREATGGESVLLWKAIPRALVEGRIGNVAPGDLALLDRAVRRVLLNDEILREGEWDLLPLRHEGRLVGAVGIRGGQVPRGQAEEWGEWIPLARRFAEERLTWEAREEILSLLLRPPREKTAGVPASRRFPETVVRLVERLLPLAPVVLLDDRGVVVAAAGVARGEAEQMTDLLFQDAHFDESERRFRALGPTGDLRALYFLPLRADAAGKGGGTLWALGPMEHPYERVMKILTEVVRALGGGETGAGRGADA